MQLWDLQFVDSNIQDGLLDSQGGYNGDKHSQLRAYYQLSAVCWRLAPHAADVCRGV